MPLVRKVDLVWLRCPGCHGNQGPGVLHRLPDFLGERSLIHLLFVINYALIC